MSRTAPEAPTARVSHLPAEKRTADALAQGGLTERTPGEEGVAMTWGPPEILTAARLPDLCRLVCERAGLPTHSEGITTDRFI
ncbi:MAG TPA: hypothetical protein VEL76_08885, partial [Gemmataceae bacterium]|nr:hypothetical protein [Gemmataceae bacterium]